MRYEKLACPNLVRSPSDLTAFNMVNWAIIVISVFIFLFIVNKLKFMVYKIFIYIIIFPILLIFLLGIWITITNFNNHPDIFVELHSTSWYAIDGDSMLPNFKDEELIYPYKFLRCDKIKSGDIVVFDPYKASMYKKTSTEKLNIENRSFVKRVIGVEGDEILIKKGYVYVNNTKIDEPYIATQGATWGWSTDNVGFIKNNFPIVVTKDYLFVLGDNRKYSGDSRDFGFVPISAVKSFIPLEKQNFNK